MINIIKTQTKSKQVQNFWRKSIIYVITIVLLISLSGCQTQKYQQTLELGDLAEQSEERVEAKIEYIKETAKADFERHYGQGRFDKDFSILNLEANELFKSKVMEDLNAIEDGVYFIMGEIAFFNDSLEKVENGDLATEDLVENTLEHAKDSDLTIYVLVDDVFGESKSRFSEYFRELGPTFVNDTARNRSLVMKTFDSDLLKKRSIEELIADPQRDVFFMTEPGGKNIRNYEDEFSWWENVSNFKDGLDELKEKYNEDFIILNPVNGARSRHYMCAPAKDVNLEFFDGTAAIDEDRYLNVLAQSIFDKEIEAVIEKYGAQDKIAYYSAIVDYKYTRFHTDFVDDIYELLKSDGKLRNETTLYYLKEPEEMIDARLIFEVSKDIQLLTKELSPKRNVIWVRFFDMESDNRAVALNLLKSKGLLGGIEREQKTFVRLETLDEVDADAIAFYYLYTYGNEMEYVLQLNELLDDEYGEDFIELNKEKGFWR